MSTTSTPSASPQKTIDLTPRSKIRALLASVDDDSDKENEKVAPIVRQIAPATTTVSPPRDNNDAAQSEQETDEDVVRPRARKNTVVARLLEQDKNAASSDEDSAPDGNAYERIRKQLTMAEKPETATASGKDTNACSNPSSDSDAIPVSRRITKRKRVERPSSPVRSRTPAARSSPGLFVSSPEKSRSSPPIDDQNSDSDALHDLAQMSRLQALVAKKREERLAKERASEQANEAPPSSPAPGNSSTKKKTPRTSKAVQVESETDDDRDIADKLTSSARPTRKASKRAMEEMHRETQRMSRNMQLTHEAKTKTKFTTDALFKKFGFRQSNAVAPVETEQGTTATSSIPGTSDSEKLLGTPPSSPPMVGEDILKTAAIDVTRSSPLPTIPDAEDDDVVELPDLHSALSQAAEANSKAQYTAQQPMPQRISAKKFGKSVRRPVPIEADDDEDDGLEIVQDKRPSRLDIFDLIKPAKSRPTGNLHVVRALANVNDTAHAHGKKGRPSMTAGELHVALQRRAREQAQRDREEKIQRLREKGIYVQTAEEKEKEQLQVEDMLEKARREAGELAKREKEAAKKEGREVGGGAMPDSDDEDDEDWDGEEEEAGEEGEADVDMELSGSEEEVDAAEETEEEEDACEDEVVEEEDAAGALIDGEAEDASDEDDEHASIDEGQEMLKDGLPHTSRRPRKKIVDSDDDDEEHASALPLATAITPARTREHAATPKSALADAFGFAQPQAITGGLSQMFAGTMAESQTSLRGDTQAFDSQQDSLAFLRGLAQPDLPMPDFSASIADDSQDIIIPNSQAEQSQNREIMSQPSLFRFETQTQVPYLESQEMSQVPEPTQDVGFQHFPTPVKPAARLQESFATVDTVALSPRPAQQAVLSDDDEEDLVQRKKGRLVRREQRVCPEIEEQVDAHQAVDEESAIDNDDTEQNAFLIMRKAATNPSIPVFDKKRSEAKGMIEEQAEESEDEYAGLGGASDSEDGEYDEETRKMIDDTSKEKLNERAVAKFHADKERAEDEKRVERLFKDIANGGLRRKRGAEMELWESDDEDEAMARRRAAKQREFAKMRKALLADEKLGKIAENPKQQAFLAAIEDHDENDPFDLLDVVEESQPTFSQVVDESQSQPQASADTTTIKNNNSGSSTTRPPSNLRRTARSSKPSSLLEIRNTLSELIGEDSLAEATAEDAAFEDEELQHQDSMDIDIDLDNDDGDVDDLAEGRSELMPPPPPPVAIPARPAAIDRRRSRPQSNTTTLPANQHQTTLAFAPTSANLPTFFRKPSLLRRATTASSTEGNTVATNSARGGLGGDGSIRQGGTNKSSINYHVREKEKMARVERVERERREGRERVGKMRRKVLVEGKGEGEGKGLGGRGKLGALGGGAWE